MPAFITKPDEIVSKVREIEAQGDLVRLALEIGNEEILLITGPRTMPRQYERRG